MRLLSSRLISALCAACLGLSFPAAQASEPAQATYSPATLSLYRPAVEAPLACEHTEREAHAPALNAFTGVALSDLPNDLGLDGASLASQIKAALPRELGTIHSVSLITSDEEGLLLLVISESGTRKAKSLGSIITTPLPSARSLPLRSDDISIVSQHDLSASPMSVHVSLADRSTVVEFPALGLKRVFPASMGALDPVREYPELTSLTPIMELGRINPKGSKRNTPKGSWLRGLPFLNIEGAFGRSTPAPLTPTRLGYYRTNLGFHASPVQFRRTYNSHGCITLRDGELLELASLVLSREAPTPLQIQAAPFEHERHPLPFESQRFARLVNVGTPTAPRFTLRGALYHIEYLDEGLPPLDHLKGRYLDGERALHANGRLARHHAAPPSLRF